MAILFLIVGLLVAGCAHDHQGLAISKEVKASGVSFEGLSSQRLYECDPGVKTTKPCEKESDK